MTITATFSNGFTDTYKGKRAVKAAWMIVTPKGNVHSGHSIDIETARKTALGNAADASGHRIFNPRGTKTIGLIRYQEETARKAGFKNWRAYEAHHAALRAAFVAACKIEVVAL